MDVIHMDLDHFDARAERLFLSACKLLSLFATFWLIACGVIAKLF